MRPVPIAKEGLPFIGIGAALTLIGFLLNGFLGILLLGLTLFTVYFFRNPLRIIPSDPNLILSPADGKVIFVGPVDEDRFLKTKAIKISIFMSPLNVHVNRIPVSGTIEEVSYHPGKYLMAFHEKSSLENEHNAIVLKSDRGPRVLFVQIAGFLARRIVCYLKKGDSVVRGNLFGLIRFGSRMDVYLTAGKVLVKVGDKVKGGESALGRMD